MTINSVQAVFISNSIKSGLPKSDNIPSFFGCLQLNERWVLVGFAFPPFPSVYLVRDHMDWKLNINSGVIREKKKYQNNTYLEVDTTIGFTDEDLV